MDKLFIACCLLLASFAYGQETTGQLEGKVTNASLEPIDIASVVVTDTETNFKYGAISQPSGYYIVPSLPPGNTYSIEVSFLGFETARIDNIQINLGAVTQQNIVLKTSSSTLDEVLISVNTQNSKNTNEQLIGSNRIKATPTISRSIQDLTRNLPEANLNSFAGASNRFNNLNIDGIGNNDVIGFQEPSSGASGSTANGTPGSLSRTQPIGFGAIKQLSIKTTPFDVSIGNFTGANINVVTKTGTNNTKTEVYAFGNNQLTVGKFADGIEQNIENFYDFQVGAGIGGALKKDKLFYYLNVEQANSNNPVLNAPGGSGSNINLGMVRSISNRLQERYNYDPGTFTDASIKTGSTKIFFRLDYNASQKTKWTLRNNLVSSFADNLEWNESIFNFGNQGFRHNSIANSLTLELNSKFNNRTSNLLSVGYNLVREDRDFDGRVFPHLQISDASNRIFAGTYREASVYNTDLNTLQLTDKFTHIKDKHTFTLGGFAQYNDVDYGFLSAWNGRWEYSSIDNFLNDLPSRVRGVYRPDNNSFDFVSNTPSAEIDILVAALYLQDRYRVNDKLTVTGGIRLDSQFLLGSIPLSEEVRSTQEFAGFDNKIQSRPHVNPRFGFKYSFDEDRNYKLTGGSGLFTGRLPYLWFAYAEYISGTEYFNVDIRPNEATPITENVQDLAEGNPIAEINLVDSDFELPREWKTNLSLNISLPKRINLSLSGTYTKVLKGIFFKSINRRDNIGQFSGADTRDYYLETGDAAKINPNFTNVFLLTNTDQGYRYNLTLGVSKSSENYQSYIGYTYGKSKDISSTVRNSPAANFEWNQAVNANDPDLSFSNFDLRHKIVANQDYHFKINTKSQLFVSLLYSGASGSPFSFVYQGDVNRDGSSRNDLIYIPRDQSEIRLVDITDSNGTVVSSAQEQWQQLDAFIQNNDYLNENRGNYAERNASKTPWNHRLDSKLAYELSLGETQALGISLDIFNVFNLLNKNWGRLVFVPNVVNSNFSLLRFRGIENNEPQFQFSVTDSTPWVVDSENSRWKMQLGITYRF